MPEESAPSLLTAEDLAELQEIIQAPHFWGIYTVALLVLLTAGGLLLWLVLKAVPRRRLPEPSWGGVDLLFAFAMWFAGQFMLVGARAIAEERQLLPTAQLDLLTFGLLALLAVAVVGFVSFVLGRAHEQGVAALGLRLRGSAIGRGLLDAVVVFPVLIFIFLVTNYASLLALVAAGVDLEMQEAVQVARDMITQQLWGSLATLMTITLIGAPLVEEFLFRGVLLRYLDKKASALVAVPASALLFGAIHMNLPSLVPLTAIGVVLALLVLRSGNLWSCIWLHALFNGSMIGVQVLIEGFKG